MTLWFQSDGGTSSEQTAEVKQDKKWTKRWEKALSKQEDFAMSLTNIFMEKVEEKAKLSAEMLAA